MQMDLMRGQIRESEEDTMAKMLWSCNITKSLSELVHQAIKVEMQIRRRSASRKTYKGSSGWEGKEKDMNKARREKIPKKGSESSIGQKEFTPTLVPMQLRVSIIKYFKCLGKGYIASECPSRHVMIVKEDRKIGSESSTEEISISSELESLSYGSHYERDLLVVRRVINIQIGEEVETQRENIFHSRCLILGNLCSMIIDWGSCVNVASERLVKKLALPTTLSEKGDLLVDKQVEVTFTLGAYEDRVVCDFDKRVIHDGVTNHFIFIHLWQRVVLKPLSPREVQEG
ncbi:hypothetical protein CR513_29861, partial [Mucuna pruriens]